MVAKALKDIPIVLGSDSANIYFSDHYADTLAPPTYLGSNSLSMKVDKTYRGIPSPTARNPNLRPLIGGLRGNYTTTLLVFPITIILLLICIITKDVYFIVSPQVNCGNPSYIYFNYDIPAIMDDNESGPIMPHDKVSVDRNNSQTHVNIPITLDEPNINPLKVPHNVSTINDVYSTLSDIITSVLSMPFTLP